MHHALFGTDVDLGNVVTYPHYLAPYGLQALAGASPFLGRFRSRAAYLPNWGNGVPIRFVDRTGLPGGGRYRSLAGGQTLTLKGSPC